MDSARKRTSRRGQQALLDIGLAALIATGLGLSYLQITSQDQRTANAVSEGRRLALLGQASATFIKANQAAIQSSIAAATVPGGCGGTISGNMLSVRPLVDAMPTNATSGGGIICQTLANARLLPAGLATTNGYGQTYTLLMALRTSPTGVNYVDAKLTTAGPATPDDVNGSMAEAIGTAGGLYATNANLANGQITGRTGAWQDLPANWQGQIAPGHAVVNLAYALHSDVGEGLQRFADSATDHSGNKLNTSLYMAGVDNATGAGTNIYLNGTGANQAPLNAVLGARQVDTVTLTNQTPIANDPNVAASASTAPNTIDDTNPNTIRVNASLNITARNRFAVADGVHVTGTLTSQKQDTGLGGNVLPGVIWDNGPNNANANGLGGVGIEYDLPGSSQVTNTGYTPMSWIATYNPKASNQQSDGMNGNIAPVGVYAYGAVMSAVFWSAENGRYFIAPAGSRGSLRNEHYYTGQGHTPNGASRFGSADFYGVFTPVIPQYGATAQVSHDPNYWNGGVMTVGLYVDGNPYVDNGTNGINVADNSYTRVGAGKNQQWNSFMDTEGNGYLAHHLVVGSNGDPNANGVNYDATVNGGYDPNSQTVIRAGTIKPGHNNGLAVAGYPCAPGYDGQNYDSAIATATNENGALLICRYTNGASGWTWNKNVSNSQLTTYRLPDDCGTPYAGAPVTACEIDIGYHTFCAMNESLGVGFNAPYVGANYGFLAGPRSNGGDDGSGAWRNAYGVVQIIEQFINSVRVTPGYASYAGYIDAQGRQDWHMWRGGTLAEAGGGAACFD